MCAVQLPRSRGQVGARTSSYCNTRTAGHTWHLPPADSGAVPQKEASAGPCTASLADTGAPQKGTRGIEALARTACTALRCGACTYACCSSRIGQPLADRTGAFPGTSVAASVAAVGLVVVGATAARVAAPSVVAARAAGAAAVLAGAAGAAVAVWVELAVARDTGPHPCGSANNPSCRIISRIGHS